MSSISFSPCLIKPKAPLYLTSRHFRTSPLAASCPTTHRHTASPSSKRDDRVHASNALHAVRLIKLKSREVLPRKNCDPVFVSLLEVEAFSNGNRCNSKFTRRSTSVGLSLMPAKAMRKSAMLTSASGIRSNTRRAASTLPA